MYNKNLSELMDKINYQFKDINLLKNALTHSSYANEKTIKKYKDNETPLLLREWLKDEIFLKIFFLFPYILRR